MAICTIVSLLCADSIVKCERVSVETQTHEREKEWKSLLKKMDLPEHMSANAMLQALNLLYTIDDLRLLVQSGEL